MYSHSSSPILLFNGVLELSKDECQDMHYKRIYKINAEKGEFVNLKMNEMVSYPTTIVGKIKNKLACEAGTYNVSLSCRVSVFNYILWHFVFGKNSNCWSVIDLNQEILLLP